MELILAALMLGIEDVTNNKLRVMALGETGNKIPGPSFRTDLHTKQLKNVCHTSVTYSFSR
jgi:hypothetical protein